MIFRAIFHLKLYTSLHSYSPGPNFISPFAYVHTLTSQESSVYTLSPQLFLLCTLNCITFNSRERTRSTSNHSKVTDCWDSVSPFAMQYEPSKIVSPLPYHPHLEQQREVKQDKSGVTPGNKKFCEQTTLQFMTRSGQKFILICVTNVTYATNFSNFTCLQAYKKNRKSCACKVLCCCSHFFRVFPSLMIKFNWQIFPDSVSLASDMHATEGIICDMVSFVFFSQYMINSFAQLCSTNKRQ